MSYFSTSAQNQADSTYLIEIFKMRESKDKDFLSGHSPLDSIDKASFKELIYFPVDTAFKVKAVFIKNKRKKSFKMKTTTNRLPIYFVYGSISLTLKGQKIIFNVYQSKDLMRKPGFKDYLFIPFTDPTNAEETYGGGRYIDFKIPEESTVTIDFNIAYNPYCAYSKKYSCPITPRENNISIAIQAGEKWKKIHLEL